MAIDAHQAQEGVVRHRQVIRTVDHNAVNVEEYALDERNLAIAVGIMPQAVAAHGVVDGIEGKLGVKLTWLAVAVDAVVVVHAIGDVACLLNLEQ